MSTYTQDAKEALLAAHYVDATTIQQAEQLAKEQGSDVITQLLEKGLVSKDIVGQALAEKYGVPYADLNTNHPSHDQVIVIPEQVARTYRIVLYKVKEKEVTITTDTPQKKIPKEITDLFSGRNIVLAYSVPEDIEEALRHYREPLQKRMDDLIKKDQDVTGLLGLVFEDAQSIRASDIHIEPRRKEVGIRFRVDGVLREVGEISKELYAMVLNKIKVESGMRIDEHRAAQDGSMVYETEHNTMQMRVSVVPTIEGEKIAIRVLAQYVQGIALQQLGLSSTHQETLLNASKKPFGMILVTGPTGSGKTTTLYGIIRAIKTPHVNITTIEDPVEYRIVDVNQIQVNAQTNLTFAEGLRSIVRQDPDIILVGEIRDQETAEISVNAALTGHLLFSTFHANDAATAIPRLLEMGVEPFVLASTFELVVAQRLVRKVCEGCRTSYSAALSTMKEDIPLIASYIKEGQTLYKGKGCNVCGGTGYNGRTAIFEMIKMTPELKNLIIHNPSSQEVLAQARAQGMKSLFEDGIEKVKQGITTIEELSRVAPQEKNLSS